MCVVYLDHQLRAVEWISDYQSLNLEFVAESINGIMMFQTAL